uniref:NADH-ubiquinone oxidoreductase chain 4 n=1 Tax=Pericoma sp. ZHK-2021 TaxID=2905160 RepID=A0A8K1XCB7_9DIPT|nr:NADH dehydrogenase subunit 4 [Pericoma sp. ZHK-2021]
MMKIIFFIIFLVPLIFTKFNYWLMQNSLFLISFIVIILNFYFNFYSSISYSFGLDNFGYGMILLSFWIISLMFMASEKIFKLNNFMFLYSFLVLFLLLMLIFTFMSMNLFLFYLFFEASLIPTLFLILGWGYQPERLQAGFYLLFYTLFASLPLFISMMYLYMNYNTLFFMMFNQYSFMYLYFYVSLIFAFLVKMPMFLVHLWLPKAHVEAPISGSMILAGVLLKLGGYGMIRVFSLIQIMGLKFNIFWISISLFGGTLISLLCLYQSDLKSLIAYSSVAHMSIVISGLMTMSFWGMSGAYLLMISHGLCSSGLFCLANIAYERVGSRSMMINKGMMNFMPSMALWWFLLSSFNMAAPPSINLLSEISLLNSIISWSYVSMIMLMLLSFFSASYTVYLYSYSQHGKISFSLYGLCSGNLREYLLLFLHWLPLLVLIVKVDTFFYM